MKKPFELNRLNLQLFAEEGSKANDDADSKINFGDILRKHTGEDGVIDIDKAAAALSSAVGRGFVPRSRYKAKLDEIDTLTTEKAEIEDKLTAAQKWQKKYEDEHAAFEKHKADADAKSKLDAVKRAYRNDVLKAAGIADKYLDDVMKITSFDDKKLGDDGKFENAEALIKEAGEKWVAFKGKASTRGQNVETPPEGHSPAKRTKEEIDAIKDTAERQRAIAENHELYGF